MFAFPSIFDFRFFRVPCKSITPVEIQTFIDYTATKRFNMEYCQTNALKNFEDGVAWFNVPFKEPINTILSSATGCAPLVYQSQSGTFYRKLGSQVEYDRFRQTIEPYRELVFLHDCLDLSIALSMYESKRDVRTEFGEAEYQYKYCSNTQYLPVLISKMQYWLDKLPYFKEADCICAIPTKHPVVEPVIVGLKGFVFENISSEVDWIDKTDVIKGEDRSMQQKWTMLQRFGLVIRCDVKGKTILLVDDMYQSGLTMQYVAMKMKEAGAKRVFGISLVKALRNS